MSVLSLLLGLIDLLRALDARELHDVDALFLSSKGFSFEPLGEVKDLFSWV